MLFPFNRKITQNTRKIISIHIFTSNHFHSSHNTFWALSQQRTPHSALHTHSSQLHPQSDERQTQTHAEFPFHFSVLIRPTVSEFPFLSPDLPHSEWVSQFDPHTSDSHTSDQNLTSDPHSVKPINNPTSYPPSRIRSIYI